MVPLRQPCEAVKETIENNLVLRNLAEPGTSETSSHAVVAHHPMSESGIVLNASGMQRALTRIAHEIAERNEARDVVLIGIQRGGVPLADRLSKGLAEIWARPVATGSLDVSMHRDDLDR